MSHFYFCLPWLLESCIPVIFICTSTPLFLLKYYCIVIQFNTTQIVITNICVIFSRRTTSLSICSMVQLYIGLQYRREWKYSTNVNCHCQSKTEESKGCNYYLPDLKSDCNNGGKLLYCTGSHLKIQRVPNYMCMHLNFHSFHIFFYFIFSL